MTTEAVPRRNVAVDAYRGLVMLLMMAEVLRFSEVARSFPGNWFWRFLSFNQSHVEWAGCSLHDTIQPGFSFLVGVALPYSIASRVAKGRSFGNQLGHAIWRSLILIVPSVVARIESNILINPEHPEFPKIETSLHQSVWWDKRLFAS